MDKGYCTEEDFHSYTDEQEGQKACRDDKEGQRGRRIPDSLFHEINHEICKDGDDNFLDKYDFKALQREDVLYTGTGIPEGFHRSEKVQCMEQ